MQQQGILIQVALQTLAPLTRALFPQSCPGRRRCLIAIMIWPVLLGLTQGKIGVGHHFAKRLAATAGRQANMADVSGMGQPIAG